MIGSEIVQLNHFIALIVALVFVIVTSGIGWIKGFYSFPQQELPRSNNLSVAHILFVFSIYFILQLTVIPTVYLVIESWIKQESFEFAKFQVDFVTQGWINLTGVAVTFLFIFSFLITNKTTLKQQVMGTSHDPWISSFLKGSFSWVVVYPCVVAIGQAAAFIVEQFYQGPSQDQVVVKNIKEMVGYPYLLTTTIMAVVLLIPFLEELLFRGFLQEWMKRYLSRFSAIMLTGVIFTLFHYSDSQGVDNIELLLSLFVLSCFLGFLKEKYCTLWASIGLHSTFNLVSVLMLLSV